jgi:hypothetical protein
MEKWEKILRHELEALVPDGEYIIGGEKHKAQTGRMGYIDFRVGLCKSLPFEDDIEDETINFGLGKDDSEEKVCLLCDGKGRRVFKNCTPPIDMPCSACSGRG